MTGIGKQFGGIITRRLAQAPVHVYRYTLKALIGAECRHLPTCSSYAIEAIERNGAWRGLWLTLSRVSRCRPGGTSGYDPVPDIGAARHRLAPWRYGCWRETSRPPPQKNTPTKGSG